MKSKKIRLIAICAVIILMASAAGTIAYLTDKTEAVTNTFTVGKLLDDSDKESWTEKDGYYYYNAKLEPGETTTPLFTTVAFDPAMDNLYKGCSTNVTVGAQAVQSANNGNAVAEAQGWPTK